MTCSLEERPLFTDQLNPLEPPTLTVDFKLDPFFDKEKCGKGILKWFLTSRIFEPLISYV